MSHVRIEREEVAFGASTAANRTGDGLQSKKKVRTEDVGIEGREKAQKVGGPNSKTFRRKFIIDDDDDDAEEEEEDGDSEQEGVQVKASLNVVIGGGGKTNSERKASSQDRPTIAGETLNNHGTGVADLKGYLQVLSSSDGGSVARGADEEDIHLQQNSCTGWNARREPGSVHCSLNQEHDEVVLERDGKDGPVSVREALTDSSVDIDEDNHKGSAHLSLVWLKVDEKGLWWPGKLVTEAEVPADFHKLLELSEGVKKRVVSLFNPAKEFEPYQAVTRSVIRPFKQYYESFKNIHPHPKFKWAVQEAYRLFCNYSQTSSGTADQHTNRTIEEKLISTENNGGAFQEKVDGDAQSNQIKPEVEDSQILEDSTQDGQSHADVHFRRINTDEAVQAGSEVPRGSAKIPDATIGSGASKRRDEESSSFKTSDSEECKGLYPKKKMLDAKNQANVPLEKLVVDLEISPAHRLILYDPSSKELHFQDGSVSKVDPESLGRLLNKSFTGLILHHCIYKAGKDDIRKRFPKHARSSNGLEFDALDQTSEFAKRLRDTWAREYKDESMPKFLKTRFVAGCIMEERGEAVNWAAELTHDINLELKDIFSQKRSELSTPVYKLISRVLSPPLQQVAVTENCNSSCLPDASRSYLAEPERLNSDDNTEPPENTSRLYDGEGWNVQQEEVSDILLRTVLTEEALCSKCGLKWRDHVVENIWGVRNDGSTILINKLDSSDTVEKEILAYSNSEKPQENQHAFYAKRFQIYQGIPSSSCGGRSLQRPHAEMEGYHELLEGSTSAHGVLMHTHSKNSHQEYLVHWKSCSHAQGEWVSELDLEKWAPKELACFKKLVTQGQVSMLGTGQRVRKRVRCDEDADRFAPLRDVDENERKLQRRRSSTAGDLEVVHGEDGGLSSSAQMRNLQSNASPPSTLPPNSHITVPSNAVLPASHVDTQLTATHAFLPSAMSRAILQEKTTTSQLNTTKDLSTANNLHQNSHHHGCNPVLGSDVTHVPKSNGLQPGSPAVVLSVASSSNPGVGGNIAAVVAVNAGLDCTEKGKENTYIAWMIDIMSKLCLTLKLPKPVENHVQELFKHIMRTSKNLRKRRKRHEVIAIELAMIWLAADQLCYALDKSTTIDEVEAALNVHYDNRSQLEGALYKKVQGLCSNFKTVPSLPTVSPTIPQPIPVPQAITSKSGVSVPNTSLRRETEPSPGHEPTKARREQEALSDASQTLPEGTLEAGVQADYPISTLASSCPGVLAVRSAVKSNNSVPNTSSRVDPEHSPAHEMTEARREQEALNNASQMLPEGTLEAGVQADYPISIIASACPGVLAVCSAVKSNNSVPNTSSRINPEHSPAHEMTEARREQEALNNASQTLPEGTLEAGVQADYPISIIASSCPGVLAVCSAVKSNNSVPNTSSRINPEHSPAHKMTEARREQEALNNASQRLPEGTPETGVQTDYPISIIASSSPGVLAGPSKLKSSTSVPHISLRIHPEPSRRHEPTEATQEQEALNDASHRLPEGTPEAGLQTDYPISIISSSSPAVLAVHSAVKSSNSVPKTSSRIDPEPSPRHEPTEARQEQEVPNNASQRLREGTPEAGLVADHSTPTTASSCPVVSAVPVTLPLESTRNFKERELSRNKSEADFGEKDPVSVSKTSLDSLLAQNIPSDPYTPCTLTSSMSTVENGLGWVIQGAFLQVRSTEEHEPCLEVVAQAVELFPCPQVLGADAATEVRNQKGSARTGSSEAPRKTFEPPVQTQGVPTPEDPVLARLYAQLAEQLSEDREQVIRAQMKEFEEIDLRLDQETRQLKERFNKDCLKLRSTNSDPEPLIATTKLVYETNMREVVQRAIRERRGIKARQRKDRDKLSELYRTVTGELGKPDLLKVEWEYNCIKKFYSKFINHTQTQQPVQEPTRNQQINDRRTTQDLPTSQAPSSSRMPQIIQRSAPVQTAEGQRSQQSVQAPSPVIPPSGVLPQQPQSHAVHLGSSHGINHGVDAQRHSRVMSTSAMPQATTQPPAVQIPRNRCTGPTPVVSASNAPMLPVPLVEAPSGAVHEYVDVLVKEKEKLNKTLERVKVMFDSESLRIKVEYDKEAEALYKRYETLLVEEHQAFTKKHQHIQQKIAKVEWNRQLAEALNLREELAYRAATGIASGQILSTAMQAPPHQPAGQQTRPMFSNSFPPSGTNAGTIYSMGMPSTCSTTTAFGYQPSPRNPIHMRTEQPQQPSPQSGHDMFLPRRTMPPQTIAQPSQQNPSISVSPRDATTVTVQSTEPHRNTSSLRLPIYTGAASNIPLPLPPDPILGIIQNSVIPSVSFIPTRLVVPEVGEQSTPANVVPEVVSGADGTRATQMGYCRNTDTRAQVASSLLRPTGIIVLSESDED